MILKDIFRSLLKRRYLPGVCNRAENVRPRLHKHCTPLARNQMIFSFDCGSKIKFNEIMGQNNETQILASEQLENYLKGKQYTLSLSLDTLP